jgi:hypothetical protein
VRRETDWRGIAAVLIVVGVFTVLILGAVYAGRNPETRVSIEEVSTVSTVLGAAIGAVASYMGIRHKKPPDKPQSGDDPPQP